jgi:glycosyltransferase involved in cell wall biosynthesis
MGEDQNKRKRVLLVSYACSPYRGSEAGVGWGRAYETAKHFDTWVICKKQKYEDEVRRFVEEHGDIPNLRFYFVPRTILEKIIKSIPGFYYVAYHLWQRRAYKHGLRLHQQFHFDLVHHSNFNCFREPGFPWKLDIPCVWGPVGGTENYPWGFLWSAGIRGAISEGVRNIVNKIQFRFSPFVRKAARHAACVIVINREGAEAFQRVHGIRTILMQDIGESSVEETNHSGKFREGPLRILCGSAFEHRKSLHLLIMALSKMPSGLAYEVKITGKGGPQEKRLRTLARRMGIESRCEWLGWLPLSEFRQLFQWADVFAFTGLRNATNTSVLHALSQGVPVICLDLYGAGELITTQCGVKIPVTTVREVILKIRDSLVLLANNRELLDAYSRGALERAAEYLWSRKGEQTAEIYRQVLGGQKNHCA